LCILEDNVDIEGVGYDRIISDDKTMVLIVYFRRVFFRYIIILVIIK